MIKVDIVNEVSQSRRYHQGQSRGGGGCGIRRDAPLDAAWRANRAARIWRLPGEAAQARNRPQPAHRQRSAHSARPHHPVQARQGPPEHRRLSGRSFADECRSTRPSRAFPARTVRRPRSRFPVCARRNSRAASGCTSCSSLLTIGTTTVAGAFHYLSFVSAISGRRTWPSPGRFLLQGFWYSGTLLGILGAHEMGHYLLCRRYNVDATLPYFIPLPSLLFLTGTLGAVISIREAFPDAQGAVRHRRRRPDRRFRRCSCRRCSLA